MVIQTICHFVARFMFFVEIALLGGDDSCKNQIVGTTLCLR